MNFTRGSIFRMVILDIPFRLFLFEASGSLQNLDFITVRIRHEEKLGHEFALQAQFPDRRAGCIHGGAEIAFRLAPACGPADRFAHWTHPRNVTKRTNFVPLVCEDELRVAGAGLLASVSLKPLA